MVLGGFGWFHVLVTTGAKRVCFLCLGGNVFFYRPHKLFIKFLLETARDVI